MGGWNIRNVLLVISVYYWCDYFFNEIWKWGEGLVVFELI